MMLLFSNRNGKQQEPNPATDRKARAIANAITRGQEKTAGWLNRKFDAMSHRAQAICLLIFCLALGGASGWLLAQAVLPGPERSTPVAPFILPQKQQQLQRLPDSLRDPDQKYHLPQLK
jgi:hypothetical protein